LAAAVARSSRPVARRAIQLVDLGVELEELHDRDASAEAGVVARAHGHRVIDGAVVVSRPPSSRRVIASGEKGGGSGRRACAPGCGRSRR
jgi:hypothetical protein